ncbi:MAG: endonuclease III [Alphaproteobacteria bacterium]|nr:endonuclease III [Alphaproteobacteria bacterium]
MTPKKVRELYSRLQAQDPAPKSELDFVNPYTLLVAVVLSAQATDKGVNKATQPLFKQVTTPAQMLKLGLDGLKEYVKSIGLYNAKAANIIELSRLLIERHGGEVPRDREALQALPGVGRKTANVVLNVAFGEPTMAVDTHVFRLANRSGLAKGKTPEAVEAGLMKITPPEFMDHAHHWLILHGRYICKARKPRCPDCLIRDLCGWGEKTK